MNLNLLNTITYIQQLGNMRRLSMEMTMFFKKKKKKRLIVGKSHYTITCLGDYRYLLEGGDGCHGVLEALTGDTINITIEHEFEFDTDNEKIHNYKKYVDTEVI